MGRMAHGYGIDKKFLKGGIQMKDPHDLCRVEYIVYRHQMRQIHELARNKNQRPSEYLRSVLDRVLATQAGLDRHES
jgi:hypothetical protein